MTAGRKALSAALLVGSTLDLQEAPQPVSHLQELLAGAHRDGPWHSLAALSVQLHHPLERGLKRQPDRLAMVLQHRPPDRSDLVAVQLLKQLLGCERCARARALGDGGRIADQMGLAELALVGGQEVVGGEAIAHHDPAKAVAQQDDGRCR